MSRLELVASLTSLTVQAQLQLVHCSRLGLCELLAGKLEGPLLLAEFGNVLWTRHVSQGPANFPACSSSTRTSVRQGEGNALQTRGWDRGFKRGLLQNL